MACACDRALALELVDLAVLEREALRRVVSLRGGVAGREAPGAVFEQEHDEGAVGVDEHRQGPLGVVPDPDVGVPRGDEPAHPLLRLVGLEPVARRRRAVDAVPAAAAQREPHLLGNARVERQSGLGRGAAAPIAVGRDESLAEVEEIRGRSREREERVDRAGPGARGAPPAGTRGRRAPRRRAGPAIRCGPGGRGGPPATPAASRPRAGRPGAGRRTPAAPRPAREETPEPGRASRAARRPPRDQYARGRRRGRRPLPCDSHLVLATPRCGAAGHGAWCRGRRKSLMPSGHSLDPTGRKPTSRPSALSRFVPSGAWGSIAVAPASRRLRKRRP